MVPPVQKYYKITKRTTRPTTKRGSFWWRKLFLQLSILFYIMLVTGLTLMIPEVQHSIRNRIVALANQGSSYQISLGEVKIYGLNEVLIHQVRISEPTLPLYFHAEQIRLRLRSWPLVWEKKLSVQSVVLSCAKLHLPFETRSGMTLEEKLSRLWTWKQQLHLKERAHIQKVLFQDVSLVNLSASKNPLAPTHLPMHTLRLDNVLIDSERMSFRLEAQGNSDILSDMHMNINWSDEELRLEQLHWTTPQDHLLAQVLVRPPEQNPVIKLDLAASRIHARTLKRFLKLQLPPNESLNTHLTCSITPKGQINAQIKKLALGHRIVASESHVNYQDAQHWQIHTGKLNFQTQKLDFLMKNYGSGGAQLEPWLKLGAARADLQLGRDGTQYDWHLRALTTQGFIRTKGKYRHDTGYRGRLELQQAHLASFYPKLPLRDLSFSGDFSCASWKPDSLRLSLKGHVHQVSYQQKTWQQLGLDLSLSPEENILSLSADDKQLRGNVEAQWQYHKKKKSYLVQAAWDFSKIDLHALRLTQVPMTWQGQGRIKGHGQGTDYVLGQMNLTSSRLTYKGRSLPMQEVNISATQHDDHYRLTFREGPTELSYAYQDLSTALYRTRQDFRHFQKTLSLKPLKEPNASYHLRLSTTPEALTKYVQLFGKKMRVVGAQDIAFAVGRDPKDSHCNLVLRADTLQFGPHFFLQPHAKMNYQARAERSEKGTLVVSAQAHHLGETIRLPQPFLNFDWNDCEGNFRFGAGDTLSDSFARVEGTLSYTTEQSFLIRFSSSKLRVLNNTWLLDGDNHVFVSKGELYVHQLSLSSEHQQVLIHGNSQPDTRTPLRLRLRHFDLSYLNPLLPERYPLAGEAHAQLFLSHENGFWAPYGQITLSDIAWRNIPMGEMALSSTWDTHRKSLLTTGILRQNHQENTYLTHTFYPTPQTNQKTRLHIRMNGTPLHLIEPLVKADFSDLKGGLYGNIDATYIAGRWAFDGNMTLKQGAFKLNYFNSTHTLSGRLYFDKNNRLKFAETRVENTEGGYATLDGELWWEKDLRMRLDIMAQNLLLMDLAEGENKVLYGKAFVSGKVKAEGQAGNVVMVGEARTEENTVIRLPIVIAQAARRSDETVQFVSLSDLTTTKTPSSTERETEIRNRYPLTLDLNLTLPPATTQCDILLEKNPPEKISCRSEGNIKMTLKEGVLSLFGTATVTQGNYTFRPHTLLAKDMVIEPGGTLTWNGPAEEGRLNLKLKYGQYVSLQPLFSGAEQHLLPEKSRYFVNVVALLTKDMRYPNVNFDIEIDNYPFSTRGFFPTEQEKKRQAFSVLFLRHFLPPQQVSIDPNAAQNSLNELASGQLSGWLSAFDEDMSVRVNMGNLTQIDQRYLRFSVARRFYDGRVWVSREADMSKDAASAEFWAGNWQAEYALGPSRRLRLRGHLNSLQEDIFFRNDFQTGVSLRYVSEFD